MQPSRSPNRRKENAIMLDFEVEGIAWSELKLIPDGFGEYDAAGLIYG